MWWDNTNEHICYLALAVYCSCIACRHLAHKTALYKKSQNKEVVKNYICSLRATSAKRSQGRYEAEISCFSSLSFSIDGLFVNHKSQGSEKEI